VNRCPPDTTDALRAEIERLRAENERLKAFANDILERVFDASLDGGDAQELALKHGLLEPETATEPCCDFCLCGEADDFPTVCNRKAAFLALPDPVEGKQDE
jgi:hypothetical protein